jgi:hypothetical protein
MVDTLGDHDSQGGAGKRPAPTIEGTATEVSIEAPEDKKAATESAPLREDEEAVQSEAANESEAGPESEPEPEREALQAYEEPEPTERKGPPPGSTIPEMKSFATHLVAGLLGGLIGVIALAFAWHLIPAGKGESSAELAKIKNRVAKLESTPAPVPDTKALAEIDARVKALESRPVETPPDISGLTDRVAQLESAMKTLADAAKNGGSVTDAAAITQQITEAEQRIQANLDKALADQHEANAKTLQAMQSSIDDVKAKVAALAEAGPGDQSALKALTGRVAKLESEIDKGVAGTKSAAAAIAFANLSGAVAEGRPYATELATIKSFVSDPGDLGPLPAYADKGIPTVPELTRSFAARRDAALAAAAPAPSGSLIDRLLASASALVKVKRVDEAATGDSASAVLARAEALLGKGDLAGAVKQIETLDGPPREAFKAWLDDAQARLAADTILQRLEATLLASASAPQKAQD